MCHLPSVTPHLIGVSNNGEDISVTRVLFIPHDSRCHTCTTTDPKTASCKVKTIDVSSTAGITAFYDGVCLIIALPLFSGFNETQFNGKYIQYFGKHAFINLFVHSFIH